MPTEDQNTRDLNHKYDDLQNEIADILLGSDSPVRGSAEFDRLISEHDQLLSRQLELKDLETKLTEVLPGLEQAEALLAESRSLLSAEEKKLDGFAEELGKAAFEGLRIGELPDHLIFADRKELQSRIESLQRQRSELTFDENAGIVEKTKVRAQNLKLTGQIKFEEMRVHSVDRALGQALLVSKEKLSIQCSQTQHVLKNISNQRKLISKALKKVEQANQVVDKRKSDAAESLGCGPVDNVKSLKRFSNQLKMDITQNERELVSLQRSAITIALESNLASSDTIIGEKLSTLSTSGFELQTEKKRILPKSKSGKLLWAVWMTACALATLIIFLRGMSQLSENNARLTQAKTNLTQINEIKSELDTLYEWFEKINVPIQSLSNNARIAGSPKELLSFSAMIRTKVHEIRHLNTNCPDSFIKESVNEVCDAWENYEDILEIKARRNSASSGFQLSLKINADILYGDFGSAIKSVADRLAVDQNVDSDLRKAMLRVFRKLSNFSTTLKTVVESKISAAEELLPSKTE